MVSFSPKNWRFWRKYQHHRHPPCILSPPVFLGGIVLVIVSLILSQLHLLIGTTVVVREDSTLSVEGSMSMTHHVMRSTETARLLPTPILLVGMPKTGTSTIHSFFERSGYRSSHFRCLNNTLYCGLCIKVAIEQHKPPLKTCGDYEVWAQMDIENLGQCHFPQIHNLEILHQEAPHATFLLSLRNMTRWAHSVQNWVGNVRSLAARLSKCKGGPKSKHAQDLIQWHYEHIQRIREFVKNHPSHTLLEINIEDPHAGEIMSQWFGTASPATNWGHENDSLQRNASKMTSRID